MKNCNKGYVTNVFVLYGASLHRSGDLNAPVLHLKRLNPYRLFELRTQAVDDFSKTRQMSNFNARLKIGVRSAALQP